MAQSAYLVTPWALLCHHSLCWWIPKEWMRCILPCKVYIVSSAPSVNDAARKMRGALQKFKSSQWFNEKCNFVIEFIRFFIAFKIILCIDKKNNHKKIFSTFFQFLGLAELSHKRKLLPGARNLEVLAQCNRAQPTTAAAAVVLAEALLRGNVVPVLLVRLEQQSLL